MPIPSSSQIGQETYGIILGYRNAHKYRWVKCSKCDKEYWVRLIQGLPISNQCRKHGIPPHFFGADHPRWKGGQTLTVNGYRQVLLPKAHRFWCMTNHCGYIMEHRLIMAEQLNRSLLEDELVHHLNGIRTDNRPENLALVTCNTHESKTLIKALQARIYELEEKYESCSNS